MPALARGYLLCGWVGSGTNPLKNWDKKMMVETDDPKEEEEMLFEELSLVQATWTRGFVIFLE